MPLTDHQERLTLLEHKHQSVAEDIRLIEKGFNDITSEFHKITTLLQSLLTKFDEREKHLSSMDGSYRDAFNRFDAKIHKIESVCDSARDATASNDLKIGNMDVRIKILEKVAWLALVGVFGLTFEALKRVIA